MVAEMVGVEVAVEDCVLVGVKFGEVVLVGVGMGVGVCDGIISGERVSVREGTAVGSGET